MTDKKHWSDSLEEEKAFWRSLFDRTHNNREFLEAFHARLTDNPPLKKMLDELLDPGQETVEILDVGAGPLTQVGSGHSWRRIRITAVDPLAEYYDLLFEEFGIQPRVRTEKGEAENLDRKFPQKRFDLVYSRNALDHAYDPLLGIMQMVSVCKPGGHCWLEGQVNEGERNDYHGLHQWNFEPREGDLVIWNPEQEISLQEKLGRKARVDARRVKNWYQVVITVERG